MSCLCTDLEQCNKNLDVILLNDLVMTCNGIRINVLVEYMSQTCSLPRPLGPQLILAAPEHKGIKKTPSAICWEATPKLAHRCFTTLAICWEATPKLASQTPTDQSLSMRDWLTSALGLFTSMSNVTSSASPRWQSLPSLNTARPCRKNEMCRASSKISGCLSCPGSWP